MNSKRIPISLVVLLSLLACGRQLPTREQWKKTVQDAQLSGGFGLVGTVHISKDDLIKAVGPPERTQVIGKKSYWYYPCADGTIQLVLDSLILSTGTVSTAQGGELNEY